MKNIDKFQEERNRLNKILGNSENLVIKRFLNLDHKVYQESALSCLTKEMIGLAASLVLRCDDCINYHLLQCHKNGMTTKELEEVTAIALIVGGSITIPHIRRMLDNWEQIREKE